MPHSAWHSEMRLFTVVPLPFLWNPYILAAQIQRHSDLHHSRSGLEFQPLWCSSHMPYIALSAINNTILNGKPLCDFCAAKLLFQSMNTKMRHLKGPAFAPVLFKIAVVDGNGSGAISIWCGLLHQKHRRSSAAAAVFFYFRSSFTRKLSLRNEWDPLKMCAAKVRPD